MGSKRRLGAGLDYGIQLKIWFSRGSQGTAGTDNRLRAKDKGVGEEVGLNKMPQIHRLKEYSFFKYFIFLICESVAIRNGV